ncbi:MAG TPA: FYDLN acid domain-containing protein [Myxococcota bacterium]|nr:FYDLN acid domain-containing protein [Myxococcota bacterium]
MDAARKTKLGQKWVCYSCGAKFYDLQKPEPLCPKCGADQRQSPAFEKPKRTRGKKAAAAPAPKKAVKPPPPVEEAEDLDTPIDPEDLEIEDIEIDEPGGTAAAAADIEEPEEEPADDDED